MTGSIKAYDYTGNETQDQTLGPPDHTQLHSQADTGSETSVRTRTASLSSDAKEPQPKSRHQALNIELEPQAEDPALSPTVVVAQSTDLVLRVVLLLSNRVAGCAPR